MKFLLVYPYPSLDSNPTLCLMLEELSMKGIEVDVLVMGTPDRGNYLHPTTYGPGIHLLYLPHSFFQPQWQFFRRTAVRIFMEKGPILWQAPGLFDPWTYRYLRMKQYTVILGVDPYGFILADYLNQYARRPLVYISFEIMFEDELEGSELRTLDAERRALTTCNRLLIQDEERLGAFHVSHDLNDNLVSYVPVSPTGITTPKTDFLRERLHIPSDQRIVLFMGAVESWAARDQFEEMVAYWPNRFCLVIHGRAAQNPRMLNYLHGLEKSGKIRVSSQPVPRQELPELVASADFGLAPYQPVPEAWWTGKNLYHLGLASGKVAYYAMAGLPILARSLPVFEREFPKFCCGETYTRIDQTGGLLERMDREYSTYRAGALGFFRERLDPRNKMTDFCNRLVELAGNQCE